MQLHSSNEVKEIQKERNRIKGGLRDCLRWTLRTGKFCGFLPLSGFGPHETLRFTWNSPYILLCLFNVFAQIIILTLNVYSFIESDLEVNRITAIFYFTFCFIITLEIFRFCRRYKQFMRDVEAVEYFLPPLRRPRTSVRFINRFVGTFLFLGLVEHIFYIIYSLYITKKCYYNSKDDSGLLRTYFKHVYKWYYDIFPFSYVPAIIFQITKFQGAVALVYAETLVMNTCIYLRNRFNDFNRLIIKDSQVSARIYQDTACVLVKCADVGVVFASIVIMLAALCDVSYKYTRNFKPSWSELQVYYTRISKLVKIADNNINAIVFYSYASNLYFICFSMYFLLKKDLIPILFETTNIMSLIIRNFTISYLAAEVNLASRKPLTVLHTIPSSNYDFDMRRLMSQVYYSKVGITGLNFFQITRGMMLAMVAKLLTYEIVLVQF